MYPTRAEPAVRIIAGLLLLSTVSTAARAVPPAKTAGVGVISTGTIVASSASVIGAPVAGFVGGFQIGWGLGCLLFDPADPANAGVPVRLSDFTRFQLPDVRTLFPSTPVGLAIPMDFYGDLMDAYVANIRAYRTSLDRYEGARSIGRLDFAAAARLAEGLAFRAQALSIATQAAAFFPTVLDAIGAIDPSLLNTPITLADALALRDQIRVGGLPAIEQFALDAWAITPYERQTLQQGLGNLPDASFAALFQTLDPANGSSTTFGNAERVSTAVCATCLQAVPEPSSWVLLASGVTGLLGVGWYRQRHGSAGDAPPPSHSV